MILSPSLVLYLNHSLTAQGNDMPFYNISPERGVLITHEQNIICDIWTSLRMNRPLSVGSYFAGHVVGSSQ